MSNKKWPVFCQRRNTSYTTILPISTKEKDGDDDTVSCFDCSSEEESYKQTTIEESLCCRMSLAEDDDGV